jgi:hypothetical protein
MGDEKVENGIQATGMRFLRAVKGSIREDGKR